MIAGRIAARKALKVLRSGGDFRAEARRPEDPRERALGENIALAAARNLALIDYHIARVSSVPIAKIEPVALDILRVAVCQMMFLDKIPPSAAVNEAVKDARRTVSRAVPFVNAVLRKLASEDRFPSVEIDCFRERLSVEYSLPRWYVDELSEQFGETAVEDILRAANTAPPIYCVVNTLKTDIRAVADSLFREGGKVIARDGNMFELRQPGDIKRFSAYKEGLFFVQDPGARSAAAACGAKPGDTVVDLCAAPGGKSFALALDMRGEGRIISRDTPGRVGLIRDGASRLGISIIEPRAGDASLFDTRLDKIADIVLLDAPCSGFGAIRKKPEIRFKTRESIAELPELQYGMLRHAAEYVKPGGRLVYATCTLLRAENEYTAERLLSSRSDYRRVSSDTILPSADTDGFFIFTAKRAE